MGKVGLWRRGVAFGLLISIFVAPDKIVYLCEWSNFDGRSQFVAKSIEMH